MHWLKRLKGHVLFKEPLAGHTTLGVGGIADVWVEPQRTKELQKVIANCTRKRIPYLVIGKGSNILFKDSGFRGVVISLKYPAFQKIGFKKNRVRCGAGLPLNVLIKKTIIRDLGGIEFLSGVPATVGGALVMNAGSSKENIGKLVESVTVIDRQGKKKILRRDQLKFRYRHSNLSRYTIIEAILRLIKKDKNQLRKEMAAVLENKRKTQDLESKSAGCIFKNPAHHLTAGEMIEAAGLKQTRYAGAKISEKHANYIINCYKARASDVFYLMDLIQRKVKKKFKVVLQPEIRIIEESPKRRKLKVCSRQE